MLTRTPQIVVFTTNLSIIVFPLLTFFKMLYLVDL